MNSEFPLSFLCPQSGIYVLGTWGEVLGSWTPMPSRLAFIAMSLPCLSSLILETCSSMTLMTLPEPCAHPFLGIGKLLDALLCHFGDSKGCGRLGGGDCVTYIWLPLLPFPVYPGPT